ncbi:S8 family serine peptidase [Aureimonas frigidaquae]|uniref:S8 family serine peptidase n=1 Tax=Aureimonas frigidaquae TaxID=424757 RepID=UPI0007832568|nr:S8 family serine peptidase [Aureimonas frigidaquae]
MQQLGDLQTVWDDYRGQGIHVGIYDTGVDTTHSSLAPNYDPSREVTIKGVTYSGRFTPGQGMAYHGTAVAGLIAGKGGLLDPVGVAFQASITSVNFLDDESALSERYYKEAFRQMTNFDVVNKSWGSPEGSRYFKNAEMAAIYANASAEGRDGLGTTIVQAGGNENMDAGADAYSNFRHTITVGSTLRSGYRSDFSNYGSSLLVVAPGSGKEGTVWTTDISGEEGRGQYSVIRDFHGTSASTPMVTGVVTLMLNANPGLGWRDVQEILSLTSRHTGSAIGASAPIGAEVGAWQINDASDWNGGGRHFSVDYGYGLVDAYGATRMAEAWKYTSSQAWTSTNETSIEVDLLTGGGTLGRYSVSIDQAMLIEHVEIDVSFTHPLPATVRISLVSPDGQIFQVQDFTSLSGTSRSSIEAKLRMESLRGVSTLGTWEVVFDDPANEGWGGMVSHLNLKAYGHADGANDVYHYTDEFATMAAIDKARTVLRDTDGGVDWIDASAVHGASLIDLAAGTGTIAGTAVAVAGIENAVGGDGADTLLGSAGANYLVGMRGNDILDGRGGADTLSGGRGDDLYRVYGMNEVIQEVDGEGSDTLLVDGSYTLADGVSIETMRQVGTGGSARLAGNAQAQTLHGRAGADTLDGRGGNDLAYGYAGDDIYYVDCAGDRVFETADNGYDTVLTAGSYRLQADQEIERLALADATTKVGAALTGNAYRQSIDGGAGNDTLDGGGSGGDRLTGMGGDDLYRVYASSDVIVEAANGGYDTLVLTGSEYRLAPDVSVERLEFAKGSLGGRIFGNAIAQTIIGNESGNILDGGGGSDAIYASLSAPKQATNFLTSFLQIDKDTILFSTPLGADNVDRIYNFDPGVAASTMKVLWWTVTTPGTVIDQIGLSKSVFDKIALGTLTESAFCNLQSEKLGAADRILYDGRSGSLYYDADGSGTQAAVKFAEVDAGLAMKASNFFVYA